MKWMRFRIRTLSQAEDILVSEMEEIGLFGAQIEDHVPLTAQEKEQMFVDIMPQEPEDDGTAVLSFFLEEDEEGRPVLVLPAEDEAVAAGSEDAGSAADEEGAAGPGEGGSAAAGFGEDRSYNVESAGDDGMVRRPVEPEEIVRRIKEKLAEVSQYCDIGEGTVSVSETEDVDWINNWKQYFHQFYIDDILVIPSWEEAPDTGKDGLVFHIDPGTAFGTGMHETTQLCIRQIRKFLTKDTVMLDVGTGSGILSILSLMFGAKCCVGTDLDPCAPPAIEDNMKANGVDSDKFKVILGNLISDEAVQKEVGEGAYDIVAANILPSVLIPLTPVAARCLKPGGIYITSGIIDGAQQSVMDACTEAGLTVIDETVQGEWHCVVARKDG